MNGTLFGIGLGPGDPELMTLKAARLIKACPVVAYPVLEKGSSFAREIAAAHLGSQDEIRIEIPMTVDRNPAQAAYDRGAQEIELALIEGHDVAVLCEGDPFFYGSFMYLHARLSDRFSCQVIPGVSSVMACAAAAARPLVARNERLIVLPGPLSEEELRAEMTVHDTVAIMKVGRHLPKLREVVGDLGLLDQAIYVERATLNQERVTPLSEAPEQAPYFSMILITKGADPWL
ncbi:MAG: precorrin-2 C(20)-methyltransferase [Pseudomonadota bacterium]